MSRLNGENLRSEDEYRMVFSPQIIHINFLRGKENTSQEASVSTGVDLGFEVIANILGSQLSTSK